MRTVRLLSVKRFPYLRRGEAADRLQSIANLSIQARGISERFALGLGQSAAIYCGPVLAENALSDYTIHSYHHKKVSPVIILSRVELSDRIALVDASLALW